MEKEGGGGCNVEAYYTVCNPLLSISRLLHHYTTCLSLTALFTQGVQLNHLTGCPTNVLGKVTFHYIIIYKVESRLMKLKCARSFLTCFVFKMKKSSHLTQSMGVNKGNKI